MKIDSLVSERRKKRKKRYRYLISIVAFLVAYFVLLGVFLFVVRSPAFQVEKITIQGNDTVPSDQIMSLLESAVINKGDSLQAGHSSLKALLGSKNMLIWPEALPTGTLALIPQIAGLTIGKNYFLHTITVSVTERQPFGIWCVAPQGSVDSSPSAEEATPSPSGYLTGEQCFWFDPQGIAFERTFDAQGSAILVVHDYVVDAVVLGGPVLPTVFLANLISALNVIQQSGVAVQNIALNDLSLEQINVTTVGGPTLYFSLNFPSGDDLPVLQGLVAKPGFDKLQYIDFTVQNRAYYK